MPVAPWRGPARAASLLVAMLMADPAPAALKALEPVPAQPSPSALPADWQHGAFAEIFVRAYADSNGDGIGDLPGLTARLDYLQSLGIRGIWLMPVTRSADHDHGYAVADYRDIDPDYGTLADFDELLAQAHRRGIGVIVDYVLNHSASSHPLFVEGAADPASPHRAWYVWQAEAPKGWRIFDKDPWNRTGNGAYFSQFSKGMPDFDLRAPGVMAWHADNLRFWLNRGVDGFRFDAVAHLVENGKDATRDQPESFALMREAAAVVHAYPNRYVVCEATGESERWVGAGGCGDAFALAIAPSFAKAAQGDAAAVRALADFFAAAPPHMALMASNHDLFAGERLWDQVGGDQDAYRLAAAAYLLAGGTPFVYYGEEVGMSAAPKLQGDPRVRAPMSWAAEPQAGFGSARPFRAVAGNLASQNVAAQEGEPDSLLAWYRATIRLRNSLPALARGVHLGDRVEGQAWSFRRELDGQVVLLLFNFGDAPARFALEGLGAGRAYESTTSGDLHADAEGRASATVPARSLAVYVSASER
jgi:glycosidase